MCAEQHPGRTNRSKKQSPRVVVLGAGFGGLLVARGLNDARIQVTIIDRQNHQLFQPLLYQVATAARAPRSRTLRPVPGT